LISGVDALFERYGPIYKWLATATVMIGTLSMVLASTIVNVAIPNIMGAFGITHSQAQWLAAGYFAAVSATMLVNSWAVESFGPRNTYLGAMAIFMVASILGGLAPNEDLLILSRVAQGAMAGIIQPFSMIIIFHVFAPHERGKGMGIFGLGVVLAPAIGPVVGGILVDVFSWRAVFFLALPFCVLGILMGFLFLPPRSGDAKRPRFDILGFALLTSALTSLMWAIASGQRIGWDSGVLLSAVGLGFVSAAGFILWQLRSPKPLLNLNVYASPGFACGSVLSFILGIALFGTTYLIPLFVQQIQGFTATAAGIVMMPAGLLMAAAFPFTGRLSDRVAVYKPIMLGLFVVAVSCFLMVNADVNTGFWMLALWILLGRIGLALLMPSINTGSLRSLDMSMVTQGSGPLNFARQLGGAFGVNLTTLALDRRAELHAAALAEQVSVDNVSAGDLLGKLEGIYAAAGVPSGLLPEAALGFLGGMISQQGYTFAFQDTFLMLGVGFMLALAPAWLMGKVMRRS
jgi:DHA2 family multidrug resistance protein